MGIHTIITESALKLSIASFLRGFPSRLGIKRTVAASLFMIWPLLMFGPFLDGGVPALASGPSKATEHNPSSGDDLKRARKRLADLIVIKLQGGTLSQKEEQELDALDWVIKRKVPGEPASTFDERFDRFVEDLIGEFHPELLAEKSDAVADGSKVGEPEHRNRSQDSQSKAPSSQEIRLARKEYADLLAASYFQHKKPDKRQRQRLEELEWLYKRYVPDEPASTVDLRGQRFMIDLMQEFHPEQLEEGAGAPNSQGSSAASSEGLASLKQSDPPVVMMDGDPAAQLNEQIKRLAERGQYREALSLAREALAVTERQYGSTHVLVAARLTNLAEILRLNGELSEALPLHRRAVRIFEKAFPNTSTLAKAQNNFGMVLAQLGEYDEAVLLHKRALAIDENSPDATPFDVARDLNNLGEAYRELGNMGKARSYYERALRLLRQHLGEDDVNIGTTLSNLSIVLLAEGDYAEARLMNENALRIIEHKLGPEHPSLVSNHSNLASVLEHMGDVSRAQTHYEQALTLAEKAYGHAHPQVATALNNLAFSLLRRGETTRGIQLAERSFRMKESLYGPRHKATLIGADNYAAALVQAGRYDEAKRILERAIEDTDEALGSFHALGATLQGNLAHIHRELREYEKAQGLLERELYIREQLWGPNHPEVANVLGNLGILLLDRGRQKEAADSIKRAVGIINQNVARRLGGMSQREKLLFLRRAPPFVWDLLSVPESEVSVTEVYDAVLGIKNLLFRASANEQAFLKGEKDASTRELLTKRQRLVRTLAGLTYGVNSQAAVNKNRIIGAERELEQVEAQLSRKSRGFQEANRLVQSGAKEVCENVPDGAVLLEYFQYYLYSASPAAATGTWKKHYGLFVIRGNRCAEMQRHDLGLADSIDLATTALRSSLAATSPVDGGDRDAVPESQILMQAKALGSLILPEPVQDALTDAKLLLIAPDGMLALVPFQVLPGIRGHDYLLEEFMISVLPSGRDLLKPAPPSMSGHKTGMPRDILLVGNPDFDANSKSTAIRTEESRGTRAGCAQESIQKWTPLPGTAMEVRQIADQAARAFKGVQVRRAEGRRATENWVSEQIQGKRFVHLATHGYFAGNGCVPTTSMADRGVLVSWTPREDMKGGMETNPLLLSGVVLAGANQRSKVIDGQDGILTALEVTELRLDGTDLVVLSACETGLGVRETGQELIGLRWAFSMSGARAMLTSLWSVPDDPTVALMGEFYGNLWAGKNDNGTVSKAAALQAAQLKLLRENRQQFNGDSRPRDWGAWVLSGDWR